MRFLLLLCGLFLAGCQSYASFIEGMETREINSCIEGSITVGNIVAGGSGLLHVYTATGGQEVGECIRYFRNLPLLPPSAYGVGP